MKVFARLFQKAAQLRARSPCRLRRGETPLSAFSFCLAFSFVPVASKEKAENDLGERYGCRQVNALAFTFPETGEGVTAVTDEVDTKTISYYKTEYLLTPFPAFSFDAKGPKEKAHKKKMP